jgi:ketosteroid isomerase-like protein
MERSEQIEGEIRGMFDAMGSGDFMAFDDHVSRDDGVLFLGTDPEEWWDGYDALSRVVAEQLKEMQGLTVELSDVRGFADGDVGWGAARVRYETGGGAGNEIRFTSVFRREDGRWRLVQGHSSIGVRNEDAFGMAMST